MAADPFVLLVRLGDKKIKLSFPKRPKTSDVAAEVHRYAKLGPEMHIALAAPDPDFPDGGDVTLGPDAELKNKQTLTATPELKVCSCVLCATRANWQCCQHRNHIVVQPV
jgi:hypothetical protein